MTKEIDNLMKGVSKKERLELEHVFRKNRLEDLVKHHGKLFVSRKRKYTDDDAEFMEKELHRFFQEGIQTTKAGQNDRRVFGKTAIANAFGSPRTCYIPSDYEYSSTIEIGIQFVREKLGYGY